MGTFAVSFELKFDTSERYSERYSSLMEAIRKCRKVWKETTSFILVETDESLENFEKRLWLTKFDSTTDMLVVIDVAYDSCTVRGVKKDRATLKSIMPQIQEK